MADRKCETCRWLLDLDEGARRCMSLGIVIPPSRLFCQRWEEDPMGDIWDKTVRVYRVNGTLERYREPLPSVPDGFPNQINQVQDLKAPTSPSEALTGLKDELEAYEDKKISAVEERFHKQVSNLKAKYNSRIIELEQAVASLKQSRKDRPTDVSELHNYVDRQISGIRLLVDFARQQVHKALGQMDRTGPDLTPIFARLIKLESGSGDGVAALRAEMESWMEEELGSLSIRITRLGESLEKAFKQGDHSCQDQLDKAFAKISHLEHLVDEKEPTSVPTYSDLTSIYARLSKVESDNASICSDVEALQRHIREIKALLIRLEYAFGQEVKDVDATL